MTFRIGQKVVCVDANLSGRYLPPGYSIAENASMGGLVLGSVYTIRCIGLVLGVVACRVDEIIRRFEPVYKDEAWFACARFRPIVERKTDISALKALLVPGAKIVERA
jgi:hypothetical protein